MLSVIDTKMPQPSKKLILELKRIFKEEYGKDLSFAEASEAASNLVGFFDLLLKIDARNKKRKKVNKS